MKKDFTVACPLSRQLFVEGFRFQEIPHIWVLEIPSIHLKMGRGFAEQTTELITSKLAQEAMDQSREPIRIPSQFVEQIDALMKQEKSPEIDDSISKLTYEIFANLRIQAFLEVGKDSTIFIPTFNLRLSKSGVGSESFAALKVFQKEVWVPLLPVEKVAKCLKKKETVSTIKLLVGNLFALIEQQR